MKKLIFLSVVLLVGCGAFAPTPTPEPTPTPTCEETTIDYRAAVDDITERWDDANAIANSTGRANLSGPVGQLQAIKQEVNDLDVPPCASEAHALLVEYMELTIDGFLQFMGQESDFIVNRTFGDAEEKLTEWAVAYVALEEN